MNQKGNYELNGGIFGRKMRKTLNWITLKSKKTTAVSQAKPQALQ